MKNKKKVIKHKVKWSESKDHPGEKGTFAVRAFSDKLENKGKMFDLKESYAVDCDRQLKTYKCGGVCGYAYSGFLNVFPNPSHQTKDGKVRCDGNEKVVPDPDYRSWERTSTNWRDCFNGCPHDWVYRCSDRGDKGLGAQGHADITKDLAKGSYSISYKSPEYCYGAVDISFSVNYLDQPDIITDLASKNEQLKTKRAEIISEEANQRVLQLEAEKMLSENNVAREKAQKAREDRAVGVVRLEAEVKELEAKHQAAEKTLQDLRDKYKQQEEYFCTSRPLWDKLAELHRVIQFSFKDYKQFGKLYGSVAGKITDTDCDAYPIDDTVCKEYTNDDSSQYQDFEEGGSCPGGDGTCASALTLSSTWVREPVFSDKHYYFDYGEWDRVISRHPYTQAPVFTYRVFRGGEEVGSTAFYQHPLLCGDAQGARNNVLSATGELADVEFPTSGIEICDSLPPTQVDILLNSAQSGAQFGGLRGVGDAMAALMQQHGFSRSVAEQAKQCLFYACFWLMRCCAYGAGGVSVESIFRASVETVSLFVVSGIIQAISRVIKHQAAQMKVSLSKRCLAMLGDNLGYASYLYSATGFGAAPVAVGLIAGLLSQMMVAKSLGVLLMANPACLLLAGLVAFSAAYCNGVADVSVLPLAAGGIFAAKAVGDLCAPQVARVFNRG